MQEYPSFESGKFYVGCNYWASHAGVRMWSDWQPEIVKKDFEMMAAAGLRLVRMFPLWPDFQPLEQMFGGGGTRTAYRMDDKPLPDTWEGHCGVSVAALDKLAFMLDCAESSGIKIMVGLVTGWMSGRLFVPPAFEGRNVLTDPEVIRWQVRFVRCLVRRFKNSPSIVAWDLGNECNCMAPTPDFASSWCWANAISSAIRLEDTTRPVVSGMHGLKCMTGNTWLIEDAGELNDILNTHPYPVFTPYSGLSRVNTLRNAFHAAAESRLYSDVGGKPCTVEEAGNLGPMYSSQETASKYLRNMLWNSYAHDCRSLLWWCGFDQTNLPFPPYEWNAMERELGLFDADKNITPQLHTLDDFQKMVDKLDVKLPEFRKNAVCILTQGQDNWGVAFSSFILAKQAGFDIDFQISTQPIKKSAVYIMPSIASNTAIYQYRYKELLAEVESGASLLVTWNGGGIQPFEKVFGARPEWRFQSTKPLKFSIEGDAETMTSTQLMRMELSAPTAEVCARDADGNPVMTICNYGKGKVAFLSVGIENEMAPKPDAFMPDASPFWKVYSYFAKAAGIERILWTKDPFITCTEHWINEDEVIVIAVNNTPEPKNFKPAIAKGWAVKTVMAGKKGKIDGNDGLVLLLGKK